MVEFIKYKNKQYPVSVGYYALKHTNRELKEQGRNDLNMDTLLSQDIEVMEPLLYYSLVSGCRAEGQVLDLQRDDMEFMLDEVMFQFTEVLPKFFPTTTQEGGQPKKEKQK